MRIEQAPSSATLRAAPTENTANATGWLAQLEREWQWATPPGQSQATAQTKEQPRGFRADDSTLQGTFSSRANPLALSDRAALRPDYFAASIEEAGKTDGIAPAIEGSVLKSQPGAEVNANGDRTQAFGEYAASSSAPFKVAGASSQDTVRPLGGLSAVSSATTATHSLPVCATPLKEVSAMADREQLVRAFSSDARPGIEAHRRLADQAAPAPLLLRVRTPTTGQVQASVRDSTLTPSAIDRLARILLSTFVGQGFVKIQLYVNGLVHSVGGRSSTDRQATGARTASVVLRSVWNLSAH